MLTTERQRLRVSGVAETVVSPAAQNPETGEWERYYKLFVDGENEPALTIMVAGDTEQAIAVTIPEHAF